MANQITPSSGWFQVGSWKAFLNGRLVSLAIAIVGAIVATFGEEITESIRQAPIPDKVKTALVALTVWGTAAAYKFVFPTPTKIKE